MAHLSPEAHQLFVRQHGVATTAQLLATGLSQRRLHRLVENNALIVATRGAYRSPSVPVTTTGRVAALCLTRPGVAIAGPTAATLWGFRRIRPDQRIHLLARPAANPAIADDVVVFRTAAIRPEDVIERPDGIRITTRCRTALDLTRTLSDRDLLSVIEQVLDEGDHDVDDLLAAAAPWVLTRRPWMRRFARTVLSRVDGGAAGSHGEVQLGMALADAGVRGLVRQHAVDLPGYGPARFDLAIPSLRWAIELDLHPTHRETAGRRRDRARDEAAQRLSWRVSRVDESAYRRLDQTVDDFVARYHRLRAAPRPDANPAERKPDR